MQDIKVLAFDTGGTILDWHGGLVAALAERPPAGQARGLKAHPRTVRAGTPIAGVGGDWHGFVNEYRRRAMKRMLGAVDPAFNIDDVHCEVLEELLADPGFRREAAGVVSPQDRRAVAQRWHALDAWPDFVPALRRLRTRYLCVSFTILSLSLVVDVSRHNGIAWDAVISCEMLRVYKPQPEAYRRAAKLLAIPPGQILMVACHNFDLDAARGEGYRTAFVHRPDEWGPSGPPDPVPNPATDLVVGGFAELAERLGR